jgi:hypothetical protein
LFCIDYGDWQGTNTPRECAGLTRVLVVLGLDKIFGRDGYGTFCHVSAIEALNWFFAGNRGLLNGRFVIFSLWRNDPVFSFSAEVWK